MLETNTPATAQGTRRDSIEAMLKTIANTLTGIDSDDLDVNMSFLEMGADSLSLLQVSKEIQDKFGLKVHFRLLLEDLDTISALAAYLDHEMPPEEIPAAAPISPRAETSPQATSQAMPQAMPQATAQAAPQATLASAPQEALPHQAKPLAPPASASGNGSAHGMAESRRVPESGVERLFSQQLQIMSQQLALLGKKPSAMSESALPPATTSASPPVQSTTVPANGRASVNEVARPASVDEGARGATVGESARGASVEEEARLAAVREEAEKLARSKKITTKPYVAYQPLGKEASGKLSPRQQAHLDALTALVNRRTPGSKQRTEAARPRMADSRAPAGFRMPWKEMCYPLIVERAAGSRVWDVDGNEYVDLTMGFGALLFGHSPSFLIEALQGQLDGGLQLGLQSPLAGQVAALISELTGVERVAFCNSGTEAVMAALRLARTVTGRTGVALFSGSYHGTFDGILVRAGDAAEDGRTRSIPMAPGIPQHMIENVMVLDYGSPESLRILKEHMHELAAVLVEPSQSRQPDVQPKAFLHELRRMTREANTALIFDEVITGFRLHPGGAQALFDVEADLVTYGKAVGAGVPVGVLAGKSSYMSTIDGGLWNYGDNSYPQVETTFFAGTYFKHPLIMAAAWAVLSHVKKSGPALQQRLNQRTSELVETLNGYFESEEVPVRVANFGSLFRFVYPRELRYMDLFFYHLLAKGVYICETRTCFLSTAHTDEDIAHAVSAIRESIAEMRAGGFIPERAAPSAATAASAPAHAAQDAAGQPLVTAAAQAPATTAGGDGSRAGEQTAPMTESQKGLLVLARMSEQASSAYNESINVRLGGQLNVAAMRRAINKVVERHDALRTSFSLESETQIIAPPFNLEVPLADLTGGDGAELEGRLNEWLAEGIEQPFPLSTGPLVRARLARLGEQEHVLSIVIHHIVTDGWSFDVLRKEISEFYLAECQGIPFHLPPPMQFGEYVERQAKSGQNNAQLAADEDYWMEQYAVPPAVLELPTDRPRPPVQTYNGARRRVPLDAALTQELKAYSARHGCTLFITLLTTFKVLLHGLTGQRDIVIGTHSAGQSTVNAQNLIGFCINTLPLRSLIAENLTFTDYLLTMRGKVLDAYQHQNHPLSSLIKKLKLVRDPGRPPLVNVVCNMDRSGPAPELSGLQVELVESPVVFARFDLLWNMQQTEGEVIIEATYNTDLFDGKSIKGWMENYQKLLRLVLEQPGVTLGEMVSALAEADVIRRDEESRDLKEAGLQTIKKARRKGVHAPG
jgi:glutamate-1-semialdehyde aminotransferase/acyl carrier protein